MGVNTPSKGAIYLMGIENTLRHSSFLPKLRSIINTGEPTNFHTQTASLSVIDSSFCSPTPYPDLTWHLLEEPYRSVSFNIPITAIRPENFSSARRYIMRKANRQSLTAGTTIPFPTQDMSCDEMVEYCNNIIFPAVDPNNPVTMLTHCKLERLCGRVLAKSQNSNESVHATDTGAPKQDRN